MRTSRPSRCHNEPETRREWVEWCQAHHAEQNADEFPSHLGGPWGELDAYATDWR